MSATLSKDLGQKDVRRNNKYAAVVDLLVHGKLGEEDGGRFPRMFPYIKDLIVFSAMVGKKYDEKEEVEKDNTGIILSTFEGSSGTRGSSVDQHNIIFMFGLSVLRDMKYLRDENVDEVIRVFEQYSNGGLNIIHGWLRDSAWNPLVILDKVVDDILIEKKSDEVVNPFS